MPIEYPDVSKDFPKLIKTLYSIQEEFDYWDDFVLIIYKNGLHHEGLLDTYFNTIRWVNLEKAYPSCPELEKDWAFIRNTFVTNIQGTRFMVEKDKISQSSLREYLDDPAIPLLITTEK